MRAKLLITASLVLLLATTYIVYAYGQSAYFVAFHKPFNANLFQSSTPHYTPQTLPMFQVSPSIASHALMPGGTQKITVSATSDQSVSGYVEAWIESPANKQIFQSPTNGSPTKFVKGTSQTFTYSYTIPRSLPKGTCTVSVIITSVDNFTDYYVNNNFATFTVS